MKISPKKDGSFALIGEHSKISSQPVGIKITDFPEGAFSFSDLEKKPLNLAGVSGTVYTEQAIADQFKVYRNIFISDDGKTTAVQIKLENTASTPFNLEKIIPLSVFHSPDFIAAGTDFIEWHVLRTSRNKNDTPGCFRPGIKDSDFENATLNTGEIPAGAGVSDDDLKAHSTTDILVISEPSIYIKNQKDMAIPGLFLGVLGQHKHLSQLVMFGGESLKQFQVVCEFDAVEVGPGEQRSTHWLLFKEEADEALAIGSFNTMLAEYYNLSKTTQPVPALYCTWYFYSQNFSEEDLDENLTALQQNNVPFDVFLLDDGWSDRFGSWQAGKRFPSGMAKAAEKITEAGYKPGIWTCPFVVMADAPIVTEHPELIAKDRQGNPYLFPYEGPKCYAVDPTSPYAPTYFNNMYKRLRDWGFKVHKFDFLRSVLTTDEIVFYNKKFNRAQAYRLGLELVRKAIGSESYILACGGLFEASIGLVDGMRTGSDTRGYWRQPEYQNTAKQNIMRSNSNAFWHTDPDAVMLRLRTEPFRGDESVYGQISLGSFTDEEAFTMIVNQYIGGGMMCFSERFADLQPARRDMYRHVIPACFPQSKILDIFNPGCPTRFLSHIKPICSTLGDWWNLAIINWKQEKKTRQVKLVDLGLPHSEFYVVFEFKEQKTLGIFTLEDTIDLEIPAHGTRFLRITPWDKKMPVIIGTDMHLTGGGVEITKAIIDKTSISGTIQTTWDYPTKITAIFPDGDQTSMKTTAVLGPDFILK